MEMRDVPGQTRKSNQEGKMPGWTQAYLQSRLGRDLGLNGALKPGGRGCPWDFLQISHTGLFHTSAESRVTQLQAAKPHGGQEESLVEHSGCKQLCGCQALLHLGQQGTLDLYTRHHWAMFWATSATLNDLRSEVKKHDLQSFGTAVPLHPQHGAC